MEKYPFLNEAVAVVLRRRRTELAMSKRKLSELAMIERIYITNLEDVKKSPTMNVLFYLSEALEMDVIDFIRQVKNELKRMEKENNRTI